MTLSDEPEVLDEWLALEEGFDEEDVVDIEEGWEESGVGKMIEPVLGLEVEKSLESSKMGRGGLSCLKGGLDGLEEVGRLGLLLTAA